MLTISGYKFQHGSKTNRNIFAIMAAAQTSALREPKVKAQSTISLSFKKLLYQFQNKALKDCLIAYSHEVHPTQY